MRSTPRSARLRAFSAAGKSGSSPDARVGNFAKPGRKCRCAPPRPATVVAGGARQATTFLILCMYPLASRSPPWLSSTPRWVPGPAPSRARGPAARGSLCRAAAARGGPRRRAWDGPHGPRRIRPSRSRVRARVVPYLVQHAHAGPAGDHLDAGPGSTAETAPGSWMLEACACSCA